MINKGIILAGGLGTRLFPLTRVVSKQLLPVYDKPMIYYPLSTLMLAGIKDILIISTPTALPLIQELLGDGSDLGIKLSYKIQLEARGIADALLVGEEFINNEKVALILGDNIFYAPDLQEKLEKASRLSEGAVIFAKYVADPKGLGIVEFEGDNSDKVVSIVEKPDVPKSNYGATGLYFYDENAVKYAKAVKPSARGEIEITSVNDLYLQNNQLKCVKLEVGTAWLDTGTIGNLLQASNFVQALDINQGLKIGVPEQIAYAKGYISKAEVVKLAGKYRKSDYGLYLKSL